jgi:tetratricopeptide (TPR) repeat protein
MHEKLAHAIELRSQKQYAEAHTLVDELYAEHPDDPLINYHYAWLLDNLGEETNAVPFYERAITNGLSGDDLSGALLGLGSTYRCIGQYDRAVMLLREGMAKFPDTGEFPVFLAMALYNTGEHAEAMSLLLKTIANTSKDEGVQEFKQAILYYADRLDEVWE